jgi:hypothetical protein
LEALENRKLLAADITAQFALQNNFTIAAGDAVEVRIDIKNLGDTLFKGNLIGDFYLSADETLDDNDLKLNTIKGKVEISPNGTYEGGPIVTIPYGAATGTYRLIAKFDPQNKIAESNEGNNVVVSDAITITGGNFDLVGALSDYTGPTAVVAGAAAKASVVVAVTNNGPQAVPAKASAVVRVVARPTDAVDNSQDVQLGDATIKVGLANDASSKPKKINLSYPADLPSGSYRLVTVVDATGLITESNENNNTATLNDPQIEVAAPFVDLSAVINGAVLPDAVIAGDGASLSLPINITNTGNVALAKGQAIDVQIFARPADAQDDSQDVLIDTQTGLSVSGLKPGAIKKLNLKSALPADLSEGNYVLAVKVDSANAVTESNESNNTAATPGNDAIDVSEAFIDLSIQSTSTNLTGTVEGGKNGVATVVIAHEGNVAVDGNVKIEIFATTNGVIDDDAISIGVSESTAVKLAPGASKGFNVNITAPAAVAPVTYQLVARITPLAPIADTDPSNQTSTIGNVSVTPGGDLTLGLILGDITFTQTSANGAQGRSDGTFTSSNGGSGTYTWFYSPSGSVDVTLVLKEVDFPFEPEGANTQISIALAFTEITRPTSVNNKVLKLTQTEGANALGTFSFNSWGTVPANTFEDGFLELT